MIDAGVSYQLQKQSNCTTMIYAMLAARNLLPPDSSVEFARALQTFSPYTNSYESDSDSEFTLDYTVTSSTIPTFIGKACNVPSDGTASMEVNALGFYTTYNWYAVAEDTDGANRQSDIWSFSVCQSIGDTNSDGEVDFFDFTVVVMQFGRPPPISDVRADMNNDGIVTSSTSSR